MLTFYEFLARRPKTPLTDPVTMLSRMGISLDGPSEVEVLRMAKQMKRTAERAPKDQKAKGTLHLAAEIELKAG